MDKYNHQNDWFYEGQISSRLVSYLLKERYTIKKDNSHNIKLRGEDLIAISPNGITEVIEIKGYPTKLYTNGVKKGQPKKTHPELQAKHWFSEAILSCIFNHAKHHPTSNFRLALAFPSMDRYKDLLSNVESYYTYHNIDFKVYFVDTNGNVEVTNLSTKHR